MSYASLSEFKSAIGVTDSVDDTPLQSVLDATDALIDLYCDRKQGFGTATETRYYTAEAWDYVLTDDLVSITALHTDDLADGTYSTVWTAGTDYNLAPGNAALDGWPYTQIDASVTYPKNFPKNVYRGVRCQAVFGWPAVPQAVKQAAIIQAGAVWMSRSAPAAVVGSADLGGLIRMTRALHPEAQILLESFRKRSGLVR